MINEITNVSAQITILLSTFVCSEPSFSFDSKSGINSGAILDEDSFIKIIASLFGVKPAFF
jgi:hypothetical protein